MRAFGRPIELPSLRDRFHLGRTAQVVEKEPARSTSIPSLVQSTRERKEPSDPPPSNPRLQPMRPPEPNNKPRESIKPKAPDSSKPDSSTTKAHDGKAAKDTLYAPSKVAETSVATAVPRPPTEPRPPPKLPAKDPPRGFDHNRGQNKGLESAPTSVQTPQAVIETAPQELTDFEKTEILTFEKVHYYGTLASKTRANAVGNDGYSMLLFHGLHHISYMQ